METNTQKTNPPYTIFLVESDGVFYPYTTMEDLFDQFSPSEEYPIRVFQYSTPIEGTFSSPAFIPKKT